MPVESFSESGTAVELDLEDPSIRVKTVFTHMYVHTAIQQADNSSEWYCCIILYVYITAVFELQESVLIIHTIYFTAGTAVPAL